MGSSEEEIEKLLEAQVLTKFHIKGVPGEGPQHTVTLTKPIGLSTHEVTRGQFRQFVEATGYKTDAEKNGTGTGSKGGRAPEFRWNTPLGFDTEQTDDHPVVNVSWNDAVAFCEWLSEKEGVTYRLPTEAEWEFACRAGNSGRFSFGNDETRLGDYAWYGQQGGTKPVGEKASNPLGLFDLHGNVWEWCGDVFGPYSPTLAVDPVGRNGHHCVLRGGAYYDLAAEVRSAIRSSNPPNNPNCYSGFRPARTFDKYEPKKPQADNPAAEPGERSKLESSDTLKNSKTLKSQKTLEDK